ncbi:MAG: metallophosphoesterase [Prevotella sp.]|nr:metallophosphoesterase [Prevotella sp.]
MNIWMLAFLLLPVAAMAYIGWHVWCLLPLSWIWKTLTVALMASSFLLMFAGVWRTTDRLPLPLATAVYEVGTSSIFVLLYLFMLFLLLDLGRLVRLFPRTLLYNNGWMAGGILVVMVAIFVYGNLHYRHKYREELTLTTGKPLEKPVRLVMMSDLHLGYHNPRKELARWVDMMNGEKPDLILIAGDIIDGSMRPLREEHMHEEFRRLTAPVYACLGNHEYYSGEPEARQFYRDAGILLLSDSAVVVNGLCLIGRDDRSNRHRKSLGAIMQGADRSHYRILLDHQPYHLEQAERCGVDFQFSGHTHHGQVWPISWITDAIYECAFGQHRRGATRYYISSGMGIWGGKFRIGTRSEYVVATVKPE